MTLISESKWHRTVNGTELTKARERLNMSQAGFAEACGWSQQYQQRLESPQEHEVHINTANTILGVIEAFPSP